MNSEFDFIQRVKAIIKQEKFVLGIGDLARATDVSQRQLRYWEKKGYIHSEQSGATGQHRKYSYFTLMQVYMIQSYMASGFTLSAAVAKAAQHQEMVDLLHRLLGERMVDFSTTADGYELDLGNVKGFPETDHLVLVMHKHQPLEFELRALTPQ